MERPIHINKGFLALDLSEYESLNKKIDFLQKENERVNKLLVEGYEYITFNQPHNYVDSNMFMRSPDCFYTNDPYSISLKGKLSVLIEINEREKIAWEDMHHEQQMASYRLKNIQSKWWYKLFKNL